MSTKKTPTQLELPPEEPPTIPAKAEILYKAYRDYLRMCQTVGVDPECDNPYDLRKDMVDFVQGLLDKGVRAIPPKDRG